MSDSEIQIRKRFGLRVRELRDRLGLTQQALGAAGRIDYKYLGGIERGEENPTLSIIVRLADALGVQPVELFELEHVQSEKRLRAEVAKVMRDAKGEELGRFLKVLRALTR